MNHLCVEASKKSLKQFLSSLDGYLSGLSALSAEVLFRRYNDDH